MTGEEKTADAAEVGASDVTVVTTQKKSILSGFKRGEKFDDHIDSDPEISNWQAAKLVARAFMLLRHAKGVFVAKWFLSTALWIPGLFIPWLGKIIADHVILGRELIIGQVSFPPQMYPLLAYLEGKEPMEIMVTLTTIYFIGLLIIGTRGPGTGAGTYGGRDAAAESENAISGGGSSAGSIWGIAEWWANVRLTQRVANVLRTKLFDRLTRVPMTSIDDQRVGDQVYRVMYDSTQVPWIVNDLTLKPFHTLLGFIFTIVQLQYTYSDVAPVLIWIAWIMFPVVLLSTLPLTGLIRRTNHNRRAAGAASTNAMEETMNNIGAVQSLGGMKQETLKFAKRSAQQFWRERVALVIGVAIFLVIGVFGQAIGLTISYVTSELAIDGQLTAGDYFAVLALYLGIQGSAGEIGGIWAGLQGAVAAIRRVFFFIDYTSEDDDEGDLELRSIDGGVEFRGVDYAYPDGREALTHVDLQLHKGELIAFVGPTGAGKTSLAYMIPAFLKATQGEVLIDGEEISRYTLDSLRRQVTYVFQEHSLLAESVRDNIRFANPDATEEELMAALETAGCLEFVERLPDGIDTILGRSGDTLSVGQQQRLSIARGLVRDSKILILDEPTAALDPKTENALVRALQTASADRLVIIIAHRLSTIRRADRIVFLDQGEVKDIGSHDALMASQDSPYRHFVELQGG